MNESVFFYKKNLANFKKKFNKVSGIQYNLLCQKGVFPYDYIDSVDKLNEVTLPSKKYFYNKLNEKIKRKKITSIQNLCGKHFQSKHWDIISICIYLLIIYLKIDIILLADVFENYRSQCHATYELDPAHYFTLPEYLGPLGLYVKIYKV